MKDRIHNIDTLEKEILRLKLKTIETERKLERQVDHLKQNFVGLIVRNIGEKIAERASGLLNGLMERFFSKKS